MNARIPELATSGIVLDRHAGLKPDIMQIGPVAEVIAPMSPDDGGHALVSRASRMTVGSLFASTARAWPDRVALEDAGGRLITYRELDRQVDCVAAALAGGGVEPGARVALLSENSLEYMVLMLGAARAGVILACQNWRQAPPELRHCLELVEPVLILHSARYAGAIESAGVAAPRIAALDEWMEAALARGPAGAPAIDVDPEDPLLILYTSGTTGLPKGALISHRAEVTRSIVIRAETGIVAGDTFIAWTPLFHMGAVDLALCTVLGGGKLVIHDGLDEDRIAALVAREPIGWLIVMPGMVDRMIAALERTGAPPAGVRVCGAMPDLVPRHQIARVTGLLDAPYVNTFGSTETGNPPASAGRLEPGVVPERLSKRQSAFCDVRLVAADGSDAEPGEPGELWMRGPTLFSGYWRAEHANREDFRDGWFHMGDVFSRNPDGTLEFVDRAKYLIKSGGENIYPAEIERVLMLEPRVAEAVVVRRPDSRWGEVPVAFIARTDPSLDEARLREMCREALAGYKQPREIRFIELERFPRGSTGKVQRFEIERWLEDENPGSRA